MEFPKNALNYFYNFNINLNFQTYWQYMLFMKVQNLKFHSNQKTNFSNDSFNWVKSISNMTGDFSKNFTKGIFEVYTGIELAAPLTKIGTYGRIFNRNTAKLYADVSFVLGLVMTYRRHFYFRSYSYLSYSWRALLELQQQLHHTPTLIAGGIAASAHELF